MVEKNAAQKAWDTRRANGHAKPVVGPAIIERHPDTELLMIIGMALDGTMPCLTGSFRFVGKLGKPVEASSLNDADRALLSIRIVSVLGPDKAISGHDAMQCNLSSASVSDIESILPVMRSLDSVLAQSTLDSEDSSLAMAIQAVSWNLRVHGIEYDGKRSKRGAVYPLVETLTESMVKLTEPAKSEPATVAKK